MIFNWDLSRAVGRLGRVTSLTHPFLGVLKGAAAAAVSRLNEGCSGVARVLDRDGRNAARRRRRRVLRVTLSVGRGKEKWRPFKRGFPHTQEKESGAVCQVGTWDAIQSRSLECPK